MSLQLGSLYVSLAANTGAFSKGMAGAMKDLEKFSRQAKKVASEVAAAAGILSAMGAGAVKLAANVDGPTKRALDGVEKSAQLLAVQIADMLLPAVRELSAIFKSAAGYVAGLDPEVKKHIASFAVWAVGIAAVAKGFSVFMGVANGVFKVLEAGFLLISSVGIGPILGIGLVIGTVIALVVLLHRAWRKNWGGIQEATASVLDWLKSGFDQFAAFMGKVWDFLVDGASRFVESLLSVIDTVQEITGKKLVNTAGLREGFAGLWKDLKSGSFLSEAFTFGKTIGQQLVDGLADELKNIKSELGLDKLFKKGTPIALGRGGPIISGAATADASREIQRSSNAYASTANKVDTRAIMESFQGTARENAEFNRALDEQRRKELQVRAELAAQLTVATSKMGTIGVGAASGFGSMSTASAGGAAGAAARARIVAQQTADATAAAMANAVGAADWSSATKTLDEGLKRAATVGEDLELWSKRMAPLLGAAGQQILGAVGDLVNSVVEGAKAGGVWGAILAAFMEIVKKCASAVEFLGVAMEFIKELAAMVEPLVKPIFDALTNLLGGIISMIGPLFQALQPLFDGLAKFIDNLGPVISAIGYLVQALGPVIEVIGNIIGGILQALKPVLDIIAGVVKVIATVVLGIIIFLNEIAAAFGDEKARAESDRLKALVDHMWAPGSDEADAAARAAAAAHLRANADEEAAKSAQKVAESLSNVPAGYRIANARYQADLGITSANAYAGGGGGSGNVTINGNVNVTSNANSVTGVASDAKKEAARERGQRTGNPNPPRGHGGDN